MLQQEPLVSVLMVTYNHQDFIAQAIQSIISQKTTFRYELVIGEDCSTDNTRDICLKFKAKYPDKIELLLQQENVGSKKNVVSSLAKCRGKYIAVCDGDDYWTNPLKLQKQVNFLENNPDFTICCHRAQVRNEMKKTLTVPKAFKKTEYTQVDVANHNLVQTITEVYRKDVLDTFPEEFYNSISSDYFVNLMLAGSGKIKYFPEAMAVYRLHGGGIWTSQSEQRALENTISVLKSFWDLGGLNDAVKENLKRNYVRHKMRLYSLLMKENKQADATECMKDVMPVDYLNIFGEEFLSLQRRYEGGKEYKIGRLLLKPYIAFRLLQSKYRYRIHKLRYT